MHTRPGRYSNHPDPEQVPSMVGCESLYGVPLLDSSCHGESFRLCIGVQRNFLQFLVDQALEKLKKADVSTDDCGALLSDSDLFTRLRMELVSVIVRRVAAPYREWFTSLENTVGTRQFQIEFDNRSGFQKIFREISPSLSIAQFLQECLNDVEVAGLGIEADIQEQISQLIANCLDS